MSKTLAAPADGALITRPAARRILAIGLPIAGGMISQNLLDLADTIMVGHLGEAALAAVGIASFANFLVVALLIGLASGVQAVVARRRGEGRIDEMAVPLNGGLLIALVTAVPLTIGGLLLAPIVYPFLVDYSQPVIDQGLPYFEIRLLGAVAVGLNFSFRGFWYGIGETGTYLKIIVSVHFINLVLSYILIFGAFGAPALGTEGAAIGTTVALFCGTAAYAVVTFRRGRPHGFLRRLPRGQTMASLLRLSIPTAIQTMLFAGALVALFTIAGRVDVTALAVSNILVNVSKFAILPAMGLGFAAMSLVSEALGRGAAREASAWAWQTVQVALVAVVTVSAVLVVFPEAVLSLFTDQRHVIDAGVLPLRLVGIALLAEGLGSVLSSAVTGAGAARTSMVINVCAQWVIGLPTALLLALVLDAGVAGVWIGWSLGRLLGTAALTAYWISGRWQSIKL